MSVNLDNVKAIIHNNKNVVKIENSHGIVWQKTPEPTRDTLYYVNGSTVYKLNMGSKTYDTYTVSGISGTGGQIIGINNNLYGSFSGKVYPLTIDDVNKTFTYGSEVYSLESNKYTGNTSYKYPDWTYYICTSNANTSRTVNEVTPPITQSGTWTVTTKTENLVINGNCTFMYNGDLYGTSQVAYAILSKWDTTTNNWISQSTIAQLPSGFYAYNVWSLGNRLFCDSGSNHREYDFTNNTWNSHTWTGAASFSGSRVITDGVDVYLVDGTNIMLLNPATDTWTLYWTFPTSIRGDYIINSKGSAQLGQNARPRLA